ncbi:MAG: hypothetical protein ABSD49_14395 [Candidatus Bathyarchaeia archaeon]|jgi:hypothetical protein
MPQETEKVEEPEQRYEATCKYKWIWQQGKKQHDDHCPCKHPDKPLKNQKGDQAIRVKIPDSLGDSNG